MLLTLPRLLLVRLCAVALLLAVGFQAGAPMAAPLERVHGSAFSASTLEVALNTARRAEPARMATAPEPRAPAPESTLLPRAVALPPQPALLPPATAPPARDDIARRPSPRAPPFA